MRLIIHQCLFGKKNYKETKFMKRKVMFIPMCALIASLPLFGCNKSNGGGGSGVPANPIDLGPDFDEDYYPNPEENNVKQIVGNKKNMTIDIAINFEGKEDAWAAVAREYERLCGGIVDVRLVTGLDTNAYTERLRNEEMNPNTDWDIVQGNLMNDAESHAINMRTAVQSRNPYAGNKMWVDMLEEEAYITDKSGSNEKCYFLNSENLSTAWFVNTAACTKAGIEFTAPQTWDDLINMLEAFKQAGYKYPMGLSLTKDGISASQFSWLLRVYGDYFYRDNYQHITKTFNPLDGSDARFTYDKTSENPEASSGFSYSINRILATMLDSSCDYFVGPTSDRYAEFISQIGRLAKYIKPSAYSLSFNEVRTSFMSQTDGNNGDEAPQIMLDYSGEGLAFLNANKLKNNLDYFDYPTIVSDEVPTGTLTRDVGGNGGYLSLLSYHGKQQLDLNKDFLKYFLSPYGQSIYYKALSSRGLAPQGITTVKNNLVIIPDTWVDFFRSDKISFTGLADNNPHLNYGAYRLLNNTRVENKVVESWQNFMKPTGAISVNKFGSDMLATFIASFSEIASQYSWPSDGYSATHFNNPDYIEG